MTNGYQIRPDDRLVVIDDAWVDRAGEISSLLRRVVDDPRYQPGFRFYRDRRGLAALRIDQAGSSRTLAEDFPVIRGSQWAIVVDSDLSYGAGRAHQAISEANGIEVQIFRDPDEARSWLTAMMAVTRPPA